MELGHLQRRQRAVEDLDLVDQPVLESTVAEPLADREVVVAPAGDVLGQMVPDDLAVGASAVDIERQPVGPAGAVVGDRDMGPLVERHRLPGTDADGVARPEVDESHAELAILDQELITATARVGPGHRAVDDHRAVLVVGRLDPQGERERLVAVEVAQGERHVVLTAELERPAHSSLDHLGILRSLAGLPGIGAVGDLATRRWPRAGSRRSGRSAWARDRFSTRSATPRMRTDAVRPPGPDRPRRPGSSPRRPRCDDPDRRRSAGASGSGRRR